MGPMIYDDGDYYNGRSGGSCVCGGYSGGESEQL